jgi:hypothetical protein
MAGVHIQKVDKSETENWRAMATLPLCHVRHGVRVR